MIYSPETIDPIYQYLAHGKGHKYVWVAMLVAMVFALQFQMVIDAKKAGAKDKLIKTTKWYLAAVVGAASAYILLLNNASIKFAFLGIVFAIFIFYVYISAYGKRNA